MVENILAHARALGVSAFADLRCRKVLTSERIHGMATRFQASIVLIVGGRIAPGGWSRCYGRERGSCGTGRPRSGWMKLRRGSCRRRSVNSNRRRPASGPTFFW